VDPSSGERELQGRGEAEHLDALVVVCPVFNIEYPSAGVASVLAYANAHGLRAACHDLNIELYNAADERMKGRWLISEGLYWRTPETLAQMLDLAGSQIERLLLRARATTARVFGFATIYDNTPFTTEVARRLRAVRPDAVIVFGGTGVLLDCHREEVLADAPDLVDVFVQGEGELAFFEIAAACRAGVLDERLDGIDGVFYREQGAGSAAYTQTRPRDSVTDLDALPFPTYREFDVDQYKEQSLSISGSRGCVNSCTFCNNTVFWRCRFARRSPESLVEEIEHHLKNYRLIDYEFNDLEVNHSPEVLEAFCDLLIERDLGIVWNANVYVREDMTTELFAKMKRAGAGRIRIGVESGSANVLKGMHKPFTPEIASQMVRRAHAGGVSVQLNIIVGFPNETEEDFAETLAFLEDHAACIDKILNLNTCLVCPGNRLETHPWEFYIPIPNGHHFVVEDRHYVYWTDANGLDYPTRLRRFCEVVALLDELKIPYEVPASFGPRQQAETGDAVEEQESIATQLADYDAWTAQQGRPAALFGGERASGDARVVAVAFADDQDRIFRAFRTGSSMSVILCFDVERPLTDPVLRVQLFNGDGPEDNLMVFGNNTTEAGQPTGELAPGRYEARLVFDELNLLTGRYKVTAGVWPHHQAEAPHDARHGIYDFFVWGGRSADGAVAHLPVGIAHQFHLPLAAHLEDWSDGAPRLLRLEPLDGQGRPCDLVRCGEAMNVRLIWLLPEYHEPVTLVLAIEGAGRTLHRFEVSEGLWAGPGQLVLEYREVNLLGGDYTLTAELVRQSRPRQVLDRRRAPLQVCSPGAWGGGVVYNPGRWTLRPLD
jgi:Radical SAM superfamily/Wzt C-terminal domain